MRVEITLFMWHVVIVYYGLLQKRRSVASREALVNAL
jgi:hypothetical protein